MLARINAKKVRLLAHERIAFRASNQISRHIENFVTERKELKVIGVYMPIQTEIDIRPSFSKIRALGRVLCLPTIVSDKQPLKFLIWNEASQLVEGKFKVLVPESNEVSYPDLIICPMLCVDSRGYRLGYGGGFYDRTIDHLNKTKSLFILGCAYSEQMASENLPIQETDKPLHALATENGITFF